jgi:hypothetical protein
MEYVVFRTSLHHCSRSDARRIGDYVESAWSSSSFTSGRVCCRDLDSLLTYPCGEMYSMLAQMSSTKDNSNFNFQFNSTFINELCFKRYSRLIVLCCDTVRMKRERSKERKRECLPVREMDDKVILSVQRKHRENASSEQLQQHEGN